MKTGGKHFWRMALLFCLLAGHGYGESIPFDGRRWTFSPESSNGEGFSAQVGVYMGRTALLLDRGNALINDLDAADGIIEYDIAPAGGSGIGGALWRKTGDMDYETLTIRPHRSGDPDAVQYGVRFNNVASWQLYHAGYMAPIDIPSDEWTHVRIVIRGTQAEIFVTDMTAPLLTIPDLKKDDVLGQIGLSASGGPMYFADFNYSVAPPLEVPIEAEPAPEGTVTAWQVSEPFPETMLENRDYLVEADRSFVNWSWLNSDSQGMTNLARLASPGLSGNGKAPVVNNTVFVRTSVLSDDAELRRMRIGYSDRIKLFINGQAIYSGDGTSLSRDHRFAGSVGLFDMVYLPFKKGVNELWAAVSETDLLGWGIQARFEDFDGMVFSGMEPVRFRVNDISDNECLAVYTSSGLLIVPCIAIEQAFGVTEDIFQLDLKQKRPSPVFQIERAGVRNP